MALEQPVRELAHPVRAEVEADRRIESRVEPRRSVDDDRLDELVGDPARVARADRLDRIVDVLPDSVDDGVDRAVRALPVLVAVHRVVAADDGCNALGREGRKVVCSSMGRHVTSVGERVDPGAIRHGLAHRQLEQGAQVIDVRVHTAARDETEQMDGTAALACAAERSDQCRVREQRAVADRRVSPGQVLQEDAARADREMPDLGVAHLALWQPDRSARRGDLRVRIALPEPVEDRCSVRARPRSPGPVEQCPGRRGSRALRGEAPRPGTALQRMAGSREAPPTRAPST